MAMGGSGNCAAGELGSPKRLDAASPALVDRHCPLGSASLRAQPGRKHNCGRDYDCATQIPCAVRMSKIGQSRAQSPPSRLHFQKVANHLVAALGQHALGMELHTLNGQACDGAGP